MATYIYQHETTVFHGDLPPKSVNRESNNIGMNKCEPMIVMFDCMLRYARAYHKRFGCQLSEEDLLCEPYIEALKNIRAMLNWDGAVAMETGRTTDSKDNGICEKLFWECVEAAGLQEKDLNL